MVQSAAARLPELLKMQEKDTMGLINATFASIDKNDPVAVGNAVADIATTYVRPLESNAQSKNTAAAARAKLEPKALELRALVNPLVANTRKSAEADAAASIAGIDVALAAINAESRALDVLKLDPARVLALREDMKLIDARVAVRQAEEKKLDVKKDSTPTVDDFRKVDGLLSGEENAIRIVYANDSAALRSRLGEIEKRRAAYGEAIHVAAVAAVDRLNDRSSIADVSNAEGMLRLSLRMRTGIDNPSLPLEELAKRLNSTNEFEQAKQWTDKIVAIRTAATERFVRADAGKPLSEFPTVASETVNGVQCLNLPTGVSGTFALPKGFESAKNVSLFVNGEQASTRDVKPGEIGTLNALFELREEYCQFAVVDGEKGMLKIRNNSFLPLQIRLDGKPVLDVQPLLPKTIGGYAVEVKSHDNLVVSKDGYALTISAHTNPAGYTLWDGSGDGYHIASQSGTSTPVPNEDPLGFFKTLPDAIAALEATLGGKKTVDKMKDWSVRNKETMAKLAAYFNADGSPTKARGWAWEGGSFREEGKNYAVPSIDLLRRDENYIRMSRPSDVRYGSETKEYPSVEALIADMPKFLEKKELPPLASVLDRPLKDDDRRVLDQRVAEVGDLPTENIIKLLDAAKKIDTTDTWWIDQWTKDVLPRVASKDVRLLRYYAQEYSPRSGGGGYRTTVDAEKVADELVKAKPEDPATLRDAGLTLAMLGRKSMVEPLVQKAVPLLEKALDKGDMIAGISLMAINEGTISAMRPYAKKVLELARKEKSDQKLITELEGQLAAWEKMEPETKAEPTPADAQKTPTAPTSTPTTPTPTPTPDKTVVPVSIPNAPGQVPVVEKSFEAPIVSHAEIDRLVKIGTSESLAQASKTFFFLAKDFEVALRVAREQKSGVEQAEAAMRDLAREFNGADGKKGFADIVMESGPNAETEANLRRTHLTLRDYYPPSSTL